MIKKEFPRVGEFYYEEILPNGLTIRVLPKPDFAKTYAMLAVKYGAIDTSYSFKGQRFCSPNGVAHYLEHKMFDLPEGNADVIFSKLGGTPNAFTTYHMTAYHVQTTENPEENLQLLLRMVLTPHFTDESVDKERGIITQEIKMYTDNAESQAYETLFDAMFHHHPIRIPIIGSVESIGKITAQTLQLCYDAFYKPANMILCVKGNIDAQAVARIAREATPPQREEVGVPDYGEPEPLCCRVQRVSRQMDVTMPIFALASRCEDISPSDPKAEIAGDLAAEILAGESSALYQELYERGDIDSDFSVGFESLRNIAMISANGDSKNPDGVLAAIRQEARRLAAEGFAEEEFLRLKKSSMGRRMRDLDGFDGTCYRICSGFFDGVEYMNFPADFDSVTMQDVQEVLRSCFTEERTAISIVTPRESEES